MKPRSSKLFASMATMLALGAAFTGANSAVLAQQPPLPQQPTVLAPTPVQTAPPLPRHESPTAKLDEAHSVWQNGHWAWKQNQYEWMPGQWVEARANLTWTDGWWEQRNNGWIWIDGYWSSSPETTADDPASDAATTLQIEQPPTDQTPPAPQTETPPPSPGSDYFWQAGHWRWNAHTWAWVPGSWTPNRPGMVWVDGRWRMTMRGWRWVSGHWRENEIIAPLESAPPAPRVEVLPVAPGPGYLWDHGYWHWNGSAYLWAPGHWMVARPGAVWHSGRWERWDHHWVWRGGYWAR